MWDTVVESATPLSHDPLCPRCGHGGHHFLPCDDCPCPAVETTTDDAKEPAGAG